MNSISADLLHDIHSPSFVGENDLSISSSSSISTSGTSSSYTSNRDGHRV
jgi:hypothetical protein